jgi:thiol-disulfide isomerase/thioredoxin
LYVTCIRQENEEAVNSGRRALAVLGAIVIGITALIWAGVHNARQRMLDAQREQPGLTLGPMSGATGSSASNGAGGDSADDSNMASKLQGQAAPAFALVDLNGKKVSLADFKGKPVLVNFWATWCGPCKLEMPWLEEFSKKYAGQGLVVLGIAADDAPKNVIASVASKTGVTYPVLLKDDKVENLYGGVEYLPETFYVGQNGKVILATAGLTSEGGGKDQIEANIKKLIAAGGQ